MIVPKLLRLMSIALIGVFSLNSTVLSLSAIAQPSLSEVLEEVYLEEEKNIFLEDSQALKSTSSLETSEKNVQKNVQKKIPDEIFETLETLETLTLKEEPQELKKTIEPETIEPEKCAIPAKIPEKIQNDFEEATKNIPCELLQSLRTVEIFDDPEGVFPRAMANGRILKIRSDAIEEPEFVQVLMHELGHVVDLGGLNSEAFEKKSNFKDGKKIIYADDKSVLFYQISWYSDSEKKPEMTSLDFVGGYASLDMFEDYAESFLMYMEHGNDFRMLATKNEVLQKKYNFFRDHVFHGKEFFTGSYEVDHEEREWDITKM